MKKKANRSAAVFGKEAGHKLALRFRQVERDAVGFRHRGDHIDDEGKNLGAGNAKTIPMPESSGLGFGNFDQAERAGKDQHADDGQSDIEFVTDDLGGRP